MIINSSERTKRSNLKDFVATNLTEIEFKTNHAEFVGSVISADSPETSVNKIAKFGKHHGLVH